MLRVLIVDDERPIRTGIALKVEQLFPEAQVVGAAKDAEQALKLIKVLNPNVIITDIRMPGMDGLEFIEIAGKAYKNIRFVLMSGYQDFEYARKGIELNVENYLLKPIKNNQLVEVLTKINNSINEEMSQSKYISDLRLKFQESTEFLKDKYLNDLIYHPGTIDIKYILNALELLEIKFNHEYFTMITVILHNLDTLDGFTSKDAALSKFAAINISGELLANLGTVAVFNNLKKANQIEIIVNHENADGPRIPDQCKVLTNTLNKVLSLNATIGIGAGYAGIGSLHTSYIESFNAAMQYMVLEDKNNAVYVNSMTKSNSIAFLIPENEKLLLFSHISALNLKEACDLIDSIFLKIRSEEITYTNIKASILDISIVLSRVVKDSGIAWESIFEEDIFSDDFIARHTTLDQLKEWIKNCITSICEFLSNLRKSDGKNAIKEIKKYIDNFYYTNINFNDLAARYFINCSYLGQLFKSETGEKFTDYLTKVRMEKAKELLAGTDLKSYKIAEMVGYNDPKYFSDVFAKHVGLTPNNFREQSS